MKTAVLGLLDRVGLLDGVLRVRDRRRYMRLREVVERDERFVREGAPDGLHLPSPRLIYLVSRQYSPYAFYESGVEGAKSLRGVLQRNGIDVEALGSILDFGCGCGRVMRQWKSLDGPRVFGTDYNPEPVAWCREHLTFADVGQNGLAPPLSYADGSFDLVYAISVFTHLNEHLQRAWMRELTRILTPNGHLLFSIHGPSRADILDEEERRRFDAGELVLRHQGYEGGNLCSSFHPERYLRDDLCKDLEVVDYVELGASDARQDYVLVRRKPG
ncbi:MAG: class I SAM-dependent methyltransferase [Planctomycetota bacterium]